MKRADKIAMLQISSVPRAIDSAIIMFQEDEELLSEQYEIISNKFIKIDSINKI